MEIIDLPPTPLVLPTAGAVVRIPTQRWALERWDGEDPPGLATLWGRKPKFSVRGSRSCAELAIVDHLQGEGWHGVWVNAFGGELRSQWFPAPAVATLAEACASAWAVAIFDRLQGANGGTLTGFFDVFTWREPGQVRFCEAKVGPDRITPTQLRFLEGALRFHRLADFTIIEVALPSRRDSAGRKPRTGVAGREPRPPRAARTRSNRQDLLRRSATDLLYALDSVEGADEPETRQVLRDVAAAIQARRRDWPPD